MTAVDPVVTSLEYLAEQSGDVSEEVYRRFSARCPRSGSLMSHMDDYMIGRMMQDVLVLLMTPSDEIDDHYLGFEVSSHRSYGVTIEMFPPLLEAVRDTLQHHLGQAWTDEMDSAWARRIHELTARIGSAAATAP